MSLVYLKKHILSLINIVRCFSSCDLHQYFKKFLEERAQLPGHRKAQNHLHKLVHLFNLFIDVNQNSQICFDLSSSTE